MRIGMAVNIPRTEEERENFRKLMTVVEEAATYASKAELWISGHPGSEFLNGLYAQLMNTWRHQ